jgi:hypothetical protein
MVDLNVRLLLVRSDSRYVQVIVSSCIVLGTSFEVRRRHGRAISDRVSLERKLGGKPHIYCCVTHSD